MNMLPLIVVGCGAWAVVAAILIVVDRQRRGKAVSLALLRLMILPYVAEYRQVTRAETGRVGPLFYHYVVPLNIALVCFLILLISAIA